MTNIGTLDRLLRFVVGAILIVAPFVPAFAGYFATLGVWRFAIVAAGVVFLGTALFRLCQAYALFGIRTCAIDRR